MFNTLPQRRLIFAMNFVCSKDFPPFCSLTIWDFIYIKLKGVVIKEATNSNLNEDMGKDKDSGEEKT